MPFLSALVRSRGVVYPNAYVPLARTFPSWVTLLTSMHPKSHGVRTMFPTAADRARPPPTLPGVLSKAGFRTAVHSDFAGDIFTRYPFGFAETYAPTFNFTSLIRQRAIESATQLLPYVDSAPGHRAFPELRSRANAPDAPLLTDELLEGLARHSSDRTFSAVFYSNAHFPYAAPCPACDAAAGFEGPHRFQFSAAGVLDPSAVPEPELLQVRALYDAALSSLDDELARIVSELDRRGMAGETLLVVTGDHGENLGEAGLGFSHGDHLFGSAALRVPLALIPLGGGTPEVRTRVVRTLDLAPTLLARLGIAAPATFEGVDLFDPSRAGESLPVLMETGVWFVEQSKEIHQLLRIPYPGVEAVTTVNTANRNEVELRGDWRDAVYFAKHLGWQDGRERLVYVPMRPQPRWMLFDVEADPDTRRDLAADRPERVAALKERMLAEMRRLAPVTEANGFLFWEER